MKSKGANQSGKFPDVIAQFFPSPSGVLTLREGRNAYVHFLDIVLERDIRNQAGISGFLEFLG
jgi:hypothetical protein